MTLDKIIARVEHRRVLDLPIQIGACSYDCLKCQLLAFRAETEEMMERWDKEADTKYFTTLTMARIGLQRFAAELRAKIGEGKEAAVRQRATNITPDKFWAKCIRLPNGCWQWPALRSHTTKYGIAHYGGRPWIAHRLAYTLTKGPIPEGLTIDHLCRNRSCVNPAHLEAVTRVENVRRGTSFSVQNAAKTHCKRGHPLAGDNIYIQPSRPSRRLCRKCRVLLKKRREEMQ